MKNHNNNNSKRKSRSTNKKAKTKYKSTIDRAKPNHFHKNWGKYLSFAATAIMFSLSSYQPILDLKKEYWDEEQISKYGYSNLAIIPELKRLIVAYDLHGNVSDIDRMVAIITYNFHDLRYQDNTKFIQTFGDFDFFNSAHLMHENRGMPYMALINTKIISRDDWHDIDFTARIKDKSTPTNFKSKFKYWWEEQIILNDFRGNKFTRRAIILNYAKHHLHKNLYQVRDPEIINKFEFSGVLSDYNPTTGLLSLEGVVFRQSKSLKGEVSRDEDVLLYEYIRGITEEILKTFESSFISSSNHY